MSKWKFSENYFKVVAQCAGGRCDSRVSIEEIDERFELRKTSDMKSEVAANSLCVRQHLWSQMKQYNIWLNEIM